MKISEIIFEGGWASVDTQGTVITPKTVQAIMPVLNAFEKTFNSYVKQFNLAPIKIGEPVGSGTYYKRDLQNNPDKEYGDIDVQFIIPGVKDTPFSKVEASYTNAVKEFCNSNPDFKTNNGKNVMFYLGNDVIQVDLVAIQSDKVEFSNMLAPEHGTKGVLCMSLYSALGEALNISINSNGVFGKTIDGKLVSYRMSKGTKLNLISDNRKRWAIDLVKFMGAAKGTPALMDAPGNIGEVKIVDIIKSIKGIADTLEYNNLLPDQYASASDLVTDVKNIYISKINNVINSPKFDKAQGAAIQKAKDTKELLAKRSSEIASIF